MIAIRKASLRPTKKAAISVGTRALASSTARIAELLPDSVKDAVKSSVLDEISRHDSEIWSTKETMKQKNPTINGDKVENSTYSFHKNDSSNKNHSTKFTTINRSSLAASATDNVHEHALNSPVSPARLQMLHDPLDEWYLDVQPSNSPFIPTTPESDPFVLAEEDMKTLYEGIRRDLIGSEHPVLSKAASYFFEEGQDGGKKVRPMMVLLLSRAMAIHSDSTNASITHNQNESTNHSFIPKPESWQRHDLFQSQQRLAEISEMIHTASLFHDDVIDGADTRRGAPSVHKVFGNKMAILAGDYLLARASIFLARLQDVEVVETMSTIIEHLVRGEVMQMKGTSSMDTPTSEARLVQYLRKNFYKTASLMANSCKSAAILGGYNDSIVSATYRYGKHLGVAFQLVDDVLDFDGSSSAMGKAALADLNAGLATAPVLFAEEMFPNEMQPLVDRKFKEDGDVERAVEIVRRSDGIQRTKDLAQVHAEIAIDAILELNQSVYRDSLIHLAHKVVDRSR